jgi:hypothetical protein
LKGLLSSFKKPSSQKNNNGERSLGGVERGDQGSLNLNFTIWQYCLVDVELVAWE